jgi:hypothetical protein
MFENALCHGKPTEWWYPVREGKSREQLVEIFANMRQAVQLCKQCPACVECLQHSIENNEVGIWGGMGEKTRKRARRMIKFGMSPQDVVAELVTGDPS